MKKIKKEKEDFFISLRKYYRIEEVEEIKKEIEFIEKGILKGWGKLSHTRSFKWIESKLVNSDSPYECSVMKGSLENKRIILSHPAKIYFNNKY